MWNNIVNQVDLVTFMNNSNRLKCGKLLELCYQTGNTDSIIMRYQSNNIDSVLELCFDDINELSLKPAKNTKDYGEGFTVIMEPEEITWFDGSVNDEDYEILYCHPEITWIKAKKLRWRLI